MRQFLMGWFVQRVRKPLIRRKIEEAGVGEGSRGVTKGGGSIPPVFVTADSAGLRFCVSCLECADASEFGSADSKGLADAEKAGTSLLAGELTEEARSGAVSLQETAATIANTEYHNTVRNTSIKFLAPTSESALSNSAAPPPLSHHELSLEQAIEFIADDEFVEITPKIIRLRKKSPPIHQAPPPPARNPSLPGSPLNTRNRPSK